MDGTTVARPLTPVASVRCGRRPTRRTELLLKLEDVNPMGSIKDRTARSLIDDLDQRGLLTPGVRVVESTSGNLGLALAAQLRERGCGFVAVIDPKTPAATSQAMVAEGAHLDRVDTADSAGGYLLTRLDRVRGLLVADPALVWTDQYHNPANPRIHAESTGPEIAAQAGPDLGAVYVAVSTGGTLAGVASHLRSTGHRARVIAVDLVHSDVVTQPGPGARGMRLIPGIGGSRRSSFLRPWMYDGLTRVSDAEGIALCRVLHDDTGLLVGGSSGCALAAVWRNVCAGRSPDKVLAICPDGGGRYANTLYDDAWLDSQGIGDQVVEVTARLRSEGLGFDGLDLDGPGFDGLVRDPGGPVGPGR